MEFNPGTVTLVGGGPGDPDLITLAGLKALEAADVVLFDHLAPTSLLDRCRQSAEIIDVGKIPRGEFTPQDQINTLLIDRARAGKVVVRFKGGDSFVFGRGGEEWQACAGAGIPVQVIPGVTSSVAGPELASIPVTHRGLTQGFTVISGHVPPGDHRSNLNWEALASANTTLVIMMGVKYLPQIVDALLKAGMDRSTPAAIIEHAASDSMRVLRSPLETIAQTSVNYGIQPPAITVIGAVAQEGLLDA